MSQSLIDLRHYVVAALCKGTWLAPETPFTKLDTLAAGRLMLRWTDDVLVLAGPLRVRVTYQAENITYPLYGAAQHGQSLYHSPFALGSGTYVVHDVYNYTMEIPAGQVWQLTTNLSPVSQLLASNGPQFRIVIEPAVEVTLRAPVSTGGDLPCDLGVRGVQDMSVFFPAPCEPVPPGLPTGLPPGCTTSLAVPAAEGGAVRARFFNGMFITREDLETEQRFARLKSRLHNRAAGQGVVWGLDVAKVGQSIVVQPGYGVDCCGNDLVVAAPYRVDVQALLCDPALAGVLRHAARVHLLLEYVECPQDPRPVHGDPCAPEVTRCEMSRVRETVRLRLVAPRDFKARGPIDGFFDELRAITGSLHPRDLDLEPETGASKILGSLFDEARASLHLAGVPFHLEAALLDEHGKELALTDGNPSLRPDQGKEVSTGNSELPAAARTMRVRLVPDVLATLVAVEVALHASGAHTPVAKLALPYQTELSFNIDLAAAKPTVEYPIHYRAARVFTDDHTPHDLGETTVKLTLIAVTPPQFTLSVTRATVLVERLYLTPPPCAFEACTVHRPERSSHERGPVARPQAQTHLQTTNLNQPAATAPAPPAGAPQSIAERIAQPGAMREKGTPQLLQPGLVAELVNMQGSSPYLAALFQQPAGDGSLPIPRFPAPVPWMHAFPAGASESADPKVLVLAALYGWLSQQVLRRKHDGEEVWTPLRVLGAWIYRTAAELFFGARTDTERGALSRAVQHLLGAWCKGLLYPGPACDGEPAPHGVVIGCAVAEGNTLTGIDVWGGRRWVMHYPLLAHWGTQMGITPPDVTASRLASLVCCTATLPVLAAGQSEKDADLAVPMGGCYLVFGSPSRLIAELLGGQIQYQDVVLSKLEHYDYLKTNVKTNIDVRGAAPAHAFKIALPLKRFLLQITCALCEEPVTRPTSFAVITLEGVAHPPVSLVCPRSNVDAVILYLRRLGEELKVEIAHARAAETKLTDDLATEVAAARAAEGTLTTNLTAEARARAAKDAALQSEIDALAHPP